MPSLSGPGRNILQWLLSASSRWLSLAAHLAIYSTMFRSNMQHSTSKQKHHQKPNGQTTQFWTQVVKPRKKHIRTKRNSSESTKQRSFSQALSLSLRFSCIFVTGLPSRFQRNLTAFATITSLAEYWLFPEWPGFGRYVGFGVVFWEGSWWAKAL